MQIASASESPTMSFPCGVFRFCVRPRSGGRKKQHDESALSKLFRPEWEEQAGKLYEIFLRVSFRAQNIPAKRQRPRRGRVERGRRGTEYVGGRCLWCVAGLGQQPDRQSSTRVLLLLLPIQSGNCSLTLMLMEFLPNCIKLPTTTTKYLGATVEQKLVNSATASSCTFPTADIHSGSNNPTQNCLFADLQFHSQLDAETRNCIHQTHLILRFWCF